MKELALFVGIILAYALLAACAPKPYMSGRAPVTGGDILYFKDNRTNICFAMFHGNSDSLTAVPCSEEVYRVANQR